MSDNECITCITYVDLEPVGGSNISGEINYPPLQTVLGAKSWGIKYFKGAQIYQKFLFWGSKNFNKIEINYPGVQIFRYIWTGGLKMGVHFSRDRTAVSALRILFLLEVIVFRLNLNSSKTKPCTRIDIRDVDCRRVRRFINARFCIISSVCNSNRLVKHRLR